MLLVVQASAVALSVSDVGRLGGWGGGTWLDDGTAALSNPRPPRMRRVSNARHLNICN